MSSSTPRKKIFVTGGSGYVGSVVIEYAIAAGHHVRALSRSPESDSILASLGATPVRGDLSSYPLLTSESARADIVFHIADPAVFGSDQNYSEVLAANAKICDAIAAGLLVHDVDEKGRMGDKVLVTTGATLVVNPNANGEQTHEGSERHPDPINGRAEYVDYAMGLKEKGIRVCAVQLPPWVYGRGGSGVKWLLSMASSSELLGIAGVQGDVVTSTVHVEDAARMYFACAENAMAGERYNCTGQTDVRMRELLETIARMMGTGVRYVGFEEAEGKLGRFLARFLAMENRAGSGKAEMELGWQAWRTREMGILEDVEGGSYVRVVEEMRKG